MNWIKDCNDTYVNLDQWSFLNYRTYEDSDNPNKWIEEIFLHDKDRNEHVFGYMESKNDSEYILGLITKGIIPEEVRDLESTLRYHLRDEIKEKGLDFYDNLERKYIFQVAKKRFGLILDIRDLEEDEEDE